MFKRVKCPTCGKSTIYAAENRFRPFCSERCATLDLGAWAEEKYKVPTSEMESESVNENSEDGTAHETEFPTSDRQT